METWTKTCGPIPGGFILTHTQMKHPRSLGASVLIAPGAFAERLGVPSSACSGAEGASRASR